MDEFFIGDLEFYRKNGDIVAFIPILLNAQPFCYLRIGKDELISQFGVRARAFAQRLTDVAYLEDQLTKGINNAVESPRQG